MTDIDKAFEAIEYLESQGRFNEARVELMNLPWYEKYKDEIDKLVGGEKVDV